MFGSRAQYYTNSPFYGSQPPQFFHLPHANSFHTLSQPAHQLPTPMTPGQSQGYFTGEEFSRHSTVPHNQQVNYNYSLSNAQQKRSSQQHTPPLDPHELVADCPSAQISRASSESSIFSNTGPDYATSYKYNGAKRDIETTMTTCFRLPSAREFMEGADFKPKGAFADSAVPRLPPFVPFQDIQQRGPAPRASVVPCLKRHAAPASVPRPSQKRTRHNSDSSRLQSLPHTPHPSFQHAAITQTAPLVHKNVVERTTKVHALPDATSTRDPQIKLPSATSLKPQPSPSQPKISRDSVSYNFEENSDALFFCNTKIDYKFIVKHLARESEEHTFKVDMSQPKQRVQITENDLIRWCFLDFLYEDIKLHDRRFDTSLLIHDVPENRFGVNLEFGLVRKGVNKTVEVSMTLLKPSCSKLKKADITSDLSRILRELFLNHTKDYLGKKRRWSSTRPQWGLGADNELSIIELDITVT